MRYLTELAMCASRSNRLGFTSARPTSRWCEEPTLDELLSEPIIRAVMDADGVDRSELEAMLWRSARAYARTKRPLSTSSRCASK